MAYHNPAGSQSGNFYGQPQLPQHPMNPSDPGYYPQRPSSYFGGQSTSQISGMSKERSRDSHEMQAPGGGPRGSSSAAGSRRGRTMSNQHAFGDEGSDSDESDNDGQGFNIYNDFNNKGARYSSAVSSADLYRDDPFASTPSNIGKGGYAPTATSPDMADGAVRKPDLVVMPKLGRDWEDDEAANDKRWEGKMGGTNLHLRSKRRNAGRGMHAWARGEKKFCGWLGWRQGVFLAFFLLAGIGVMLYFVIPRVPSLAYNNQSLFVGDSNSIVWNRTPANFSFDATINLAFEGSGYVPANVKNVQVTVNDEGSTTGTVPVGKGTLAGVQAKHSGFTPLAVPVHFSYTADNSTDLLWNSWYKACAHKWPGNSTRPTLQLSVQVQFGIAGVLGKQGDSTQINAVDCPVELSATAA